MTNINRQQLDRLVDGELSDTERRQLLESFEQNRDGWRQCACAFLEAQEFGAALNSMGDLNAKAPSNTSTLLNADVPSTENTRRKAREPDFDGASNVRWWAALAACLAIGVAVGQMSTSGIESPAPVVATDSDGVLSNDTNQMIAADNALNPSFTNQALDSQYSVIPTDIEDILGRLGQRVERRRVYTPAGTTGPTALPVEEIEIVPVRWDTY